MPLPPVTLSVCVITKNEEQFISQCLASVREFAHELVVVDSGSTDRTVALAAAAGARVLPIGWRDDYAWARNVAIDAARGSWILFLDADEYWEGQLPLLRLLARTPAAVGGYLLERADVYLEPESGKKISRPVGIVRLFRNQPAFRYTYAIHEQINTSIVAAGSRIEVLRGARLIHQVFRLSFDFLERKQTNYLRLLDEALRPAPADDWLRYQRAKTLWFLKRPAEALRIFQALAADAATVLVIRCSAYCNAAILLQQAGQHAAAQAHAEHSLRLNPGQSLGYLVLGDIHYERGAFGQALRCYLRTRSSLNTLRFQQIIPGDLYLYPAEKLYKLGCCLLAAGRPRLARWLFRRGLRRQPRHLNCLYGLAIEALARHDLPGARAYTQACYAENPEWTQLAGLRRRVKAG